MPSYDEFRAKEKAHLLYLSTLPAMDAFAELERRLDDASWKRVPGEWLAALDNLSAMHGLAGDPNVGRLYHRLVEALVQGPVDRDEAHLTLVPLLHRSVHEAGGGDAASIVAWLVERARPGDAALAADVLSSLLVAGRTYSLASVIPMVEWIVKNGAAELRSRRRGTLLHELVVALDEYDRGPDLVMAALRYFSVSDDDVAAHYPGFHPLDALLSAVERALERGADSHAVMPLAARLGDTLFSHVLVGTERTLCYPELRRAILSALCEGLLGPKAWRWAFFCPWPSAPDGGPYLRSASVVDAALDGMRAHACPSERSVLSRSSRPENDTAWARFITSEFARTYDVANGLTASERDRLDFCIAQSAPMATGIGEALRDVRSKAPTLCRAILDEGLTPWHVSAAVATLPATDERQTASPEDIPAEELSETLCPSHLLAVG